MKETGITSWPIRLKLLLAFSIAVIIPIFIVGAWSLNLIRSNTIESTEKLLVETTRRRQKSIEDSLNRAVILINSYVNDSRNEQSILQLLRILNETGAGSSLTRQITRTVQDDLSDELIEDSNGLINGAWLISTDGTAIAPVFDVDAGLPFRDVQQESEEVFAVASQLVQGNRQQDLIITERDNRINFEYVYVLSNREETQGYLVVDLSVEQAIISNIADAEAQNDIYSFMILPDGNSYLTDPLTEDTDLITMGTVGAQNALARVESSINTYTTGTRINERTVLGYHVPVVMLDKRFGLVSEIDMRSINQQTILYLADIGLPVFGGGALLVAALTLFMNALIADPIKKITEAVRQVSRGVFEGRLPVTAREDEIGTLATALVEMRNEVRNLNEDMARRLDARNRDLRVTQNIGRAIAAERDLERLMSNVVNLIVENFPTIYHAQIFLVDDKNEYAVLRASTGEAGRELLSRGHRLRVGSVSVIGQVTDQGELIIARDTAESKVHRQNEFLGLTRAEAAIPLQGERILGALDVQSQLRDSFDADQVAALQTLADQIAIAIQNALLYQASQRQLAEIGENRQQAVWRAWRSFITDPRQAGLVRKRGSDTPYDFSTLEQQARQTSEPAVGDVTDRNTIPFVVPIRLRDTVLGVAAYELPEQVFTYDKVLLAEELVNRLAISLDNARLFYESQQSTERERLVNDISTKLTAHTDIEAILNTAVREVRQALSTPQVAIHLKTDNHTDPS